MRLTEVTYPEGMPIDGYGPGFFRVGGLIYRGPVLVRPGAVMAWGGLEETGVLLALVEDIDVLFLGLGDEIGHVPAELQAAMDDVGIGVEAMASPAAARTYNVLLSEGRRIAAALLPVTR